MKLVITIEAELNDVNVDGKVDLTDVAQTVHSTETLVSLLQGAKVSTKIIL